MGAVDVAGCGSREEGSAERAFDEGALGHGSHRFRSLDRGSIVTLGIVELSHRLREEPEVVGDRRVEAHERRADHDEAFNFEGASGQVKALLPAGVKVEEIYRGQMGDEAARAALLASLNSGPWLVNYIGHGSVEVWLGGMLSSEDAPTLINGARLPLVVAMTCLNGFFHDVYTESLAEALQKDPQGGAVAVWASSGLTEPAAQMPLNQALIRKLGKGLTLGEATSQAKAAASDPDVRRSWILFGDPTTRLH